MRFPFYESAPKETVTECNCCGSKRYRLVSTLDRYGLDAPSARCADCGLIFLSYRMTADAYREFYEQGHYRALLEIVFKKSRGPTMLESDQTRYAERLSARLAQFMTGREGGLHLDLGGSVGIVAERLSRDFNLDSTVVEASQVEAEKARGRGLAVAPVRLQDYEAGGNHYDLITLCRTVDHLLDIKADLGRIRQWLAPGGLFYVDYVIEPETKIDHPYLLSHGPMRRYLEQAGFVLKATTMMDKRHRAELCEGA